MLRLKSLKEEKVAPKEKILVQEAVTPLFTKKRNSLRMYTEVARFRRTSTRLIACFRRGRECAVRHLLQASSQLLVIQCRGL